jgi:phosphotransferase system enzyme I (PtsP)
VPDAYLRERLHDLDDLSNRLLRILTGQGKDTGAEMPPDPILIARNIGPGELLDYGRRKLKGIVLEQGSVGSHAAIVARALAIPLVIHAADHDRGAERRSHPGRRRSGHRASAPRGHGRSAFRDKMAMQAEAQERYVSIRDKPAEALAGRWCRCR